MKVVAMAIIVLSTAITFAIILGAMVLAGAALKSVPLGGAIFIVMLTVVCMAISLWSGRRFTRWMNARNRRDMERLHQLRRR